MPKSNSKASPLHLAFSQATKAERACLIGPSSECGADVVKAHAIQKARLRLLAGKNGKVKILTPDLLKRFDMAQSSNPSSSVRLIGEERHINSDIMTAQMACGKHDKAVFQPIEDHPIDPNNPFHCLLLAYRASLFQLHAKKVFNRMFSIIGLTYPVDPVLAQSMRQDVVVMQRITDRISNEINNGKTHPEAWPLTHKTIRIPANPRVAASTVLIRDGHYLLTPRELEAVKKAKIPRPAQEIPIVLNVFPERTHHYAVVSYPEGFDTLAGIITPALTARSPSSSAAELSKTLLDESENIIISLSAWRSFSKEKQQRIQEQFLGSLPTVSRPLITTEDILASEDAAVGLAYEHEPDFIDNCDPEEMNLFT